MTDPPRCASCHRETDPADRHWSGERYCCTVCLPQLIELGLAALAYTRVESKARR